MTIKHRHLRRCAALLAPLLVGALPLTGTGLAHAATDSGTHSDSGQGQASYRAGIYVVKLTDAPVAAYGGGLPGLKRTTPAPGTRLAPDSAPVKDYLRHLDGERDKVLDAVPAVKTIYDYAYTFNGFAAKLTAKQAAKLAATPGVVSVTPDTINHPTATDTQGTDHAPLGQTAIPLADHALRDQAATAAGVHPPRHTDTATVKAATAALPDTPKFLGLSGKKGLWSELGGPEHAGEGMIIGDIDAVDPSNPMLAPLPEPRPDAAVIAKKWHGTCDKGDDSDPDHQITCNNKLIGAAWFRAGIPDPEPVDVPSPLDMDSHGTHTATTAAGDYDTPVSIPEANVSGTLSGMAPAARLAVYKACWNTGCPDVDTAAAIDRAVADGVDVISFSIGGGLTSPTSAEAMSNAARAGVFVSASAANEGPQTVENTAPWITTVAAETHDIAYHATLTLGDGGTFTNVSLNPGVAKAPLADATAVRKQDADPAQAALCVPGTLDPDKAKGKIVLCDRGGTQPDGSTLFVEDKMNEVKDAGGVAVVVANTATSAQDFFSDTTLPMVQVGVEDGKSVRSYAERSDATATLSPTVSGHAVAPDIASFSSSGPDPYSGGDLLKPDIAAPGDTIAAGTVPGGYSSYSGPFGFMSGTSMAAPHIAGLATLLKQLHPDWSPMEIKSALMTTATTKNNEGGPIGRQIAGAQETGTATPLDYGAGSVLPTSAADPGLVYDSTSADWTAYLCALGEDDAAGGADVCATAPKTDPSDLNYPSLAVGDVYGTQTVTRTVTNVSPQSATYKATLQTPKGYKAEVTPSELTVAPGESATYKVTLTRTGTAYDSWSFGSLTWSDAHSAHRVTSPIALRVGFGAPTDVTASGSSTTLTPHVGWAGRLTTASTGLYAAEKSTGTLTGTNADDAFYTHPAASDAVAKIHVTVPADAQFARVGISSADFVAGSDVDLYAFDENGTLVSPWPGTGSDEHADLPPGDYDVYLVQYALPDGTTSQPYTLRTWTVGHGTPAAGATVTPATQDIPADGRPTVTVAWPDATPGETYLGVVTYSDGTGSEPVGSTVLTVTP
ncbi:Cucumisin [Actinobacteria bacterium OK074]|nr:Cucumisin [Actinobacteria bacterium OK074]